MDLSIIWIKAMEAMKKNKSKKKLKKKQKTGPEGEEMASDVVELEMLKEKVEESS